MNVVTLLHAIGEEMTAMVTAAVGRPFLGASAGKIGRAYRRRLGARRRHTTINHKVEEEVVEERKTQRRMRRPSDALRRFPTHKALVAGRLRDVGDGASAGLGGAVLSGQRRRCIHGVQAAAFLAAPSNAWAVGCGVGGSTSAELWWGLCRGGGRWQRSMGRRWRVSYVGALAA